MVWTKFMDMHSGGGNAEDAFDYLYMEAPEAEACQIFYNRFGHNPHRVSCTCCGSDYSVRESVSLQQATAYERHCDYDKETKQYIEKVDHIYKRIGLIPLEEYLKQDNVLVIRADEIEPKEKEGTLPVEGYVWV